MKTEDLFKNYDKIAERTKGSAVVLNYLENQCAFDLFHYAFHLLIDIYPLSEMEYTRSSIHRRASYSYLTQIVEGIHDVLKLLILSLNNEPENSYFKRIIQAECLGLIPPNLTESLIQFQRMRNRCVHENRRFNRASSLYDHLLELILVSLAIDGLHRVFNRQDIKVQVVNSAMLVSLLSAPPKDKEELKKYELAREKLQYEKLVPTFRVGIIK